MAIGPAEIAEDIPLRTFSRDLQVFTDLLRRNGATVAISTLPPAEWIREAPSSAFRRRLDAFDWTNRRNAQRNGALLVDIGSEELASPTSWVDAVFAALGNPALPGRSAPRDRAPERPEAIGDALVPPRSAADERLVAAQSMPVASGPCGARA